MKRLLLKKLIVISRNEQSSLEVPFEKGLNIMSIPLIEDHSLRWRSPPNTLSKSTSSKY